MTDLQAARETMAALLRAAVDAQAHPFMPARIVPPAVIVLPGSPYLDAGDTFGTFELRLEVVIVAGAKVNETAANTLDGLILDAVVELTNADVSVVEVSEPWALTSSNAEYLAATIATSQTIRP